MSPAVLAWDENSVLAYILEHHPVLQAQREAHESAKLLNRLPAIEAMIGERYQATANLDAAANNTARIRASAEERIAAERQALSNAHTPEERAKVQQRLDATSKRAAADIEEADAALEKAQLSAAYEDFSSRRRYALTEISQLRRRWAEKSTHRLEQETKAAEIRQTVLGDLSKLRELEAERMAADTRLGFLKSKSGWLQKQVAQGHPENELWENAKQQNAETSTLKRVDLLIESQRQQIAHYAGAQWRALLDYLSGKLRELPES